MQAERVVVSKVANAFFTDAKPVAALSALGFDARRAEERLGGLWVGGRVTLTTSFLMFRANAMNRAVNDGEIDAVFPLVAVEEVAFERGVLTNIVNARSELGTLRVRCYWARAFTDAVTAAVAEARSAAALAPGESFAERVAEGSASEQIKRSLEAARGLLGE
jgi:hypothetical protein